MTKIKKTGRRKKVDPKTLEKRNHRKQIRATFNNIGFEKVISVSDKEFEFKNRKGDFDDFFVFENIIVLVEYTTTQTKNISKHLLPKKVLFDHISNNKKEFIEFLENKFPTFKSSRNQKYPISKCQLIILYCSKYKIENEHKKQLPYVKFFDYPILQYFLSISKIIKKSTRFELFDFFKLDYDQIGNKVIEISTSEEKRYSGHILPEEHSCFDKDFKVVSFYIDPNSLLRRAYVLRKSGWKNVDGLYQRMVINKKIGEMRKYLNKEGRVFINNLIVSLPFEKIELLDENGVGVKNNFTKTQPITIRINDESNLIGLIDGQHRAYAYHEGNDIYEDKIAGLREMQNLLVTGIIYPKDLPDIKRLEFEAKLFLEINANQTGADSELKQAIELLLYPSSTISIAKSIVLMLGEKGPLETYLKQYFYDKGKIPTTSIVSYGLKPLVKLSGEDSLLSIWDEDKKKELLLNKSDRILLDEYKGFCVSEINKLLSGYKQNIPDDLWTTDQKKSKILTTTSINGLISCLRYLIKNKKNGSYEHYTSKLKNIDSFKFENYKSSQWNSLGSEIYKQFFE